ncbi:MAG: hypothetical protein KAZ20_02005 [Sediminibacterium sp.]|nr:hypothetical protein [Sediminibacterium sp.]
MKQLLILFSMMLGIVFANAQPRPPHRQGAMPPPPPPIERMSKEHRAQLESFKIQFITKKLDLTPAEAEKFWPVYNEQKEASHKVMQEKKEDEIEFQEAMLVIRKRFKKDLMPILKSEERVNQALKVDRELVNKMRNEMMRRKRPMQ